MPFVIDEEKAKFPDTQALPVALLSTDVPGNKCFLFYRPMVRRWLKEPRWTTAHNIYKELHNGNFMPDDQAARELAWQVFFQLYVMPYELKKRKENGDVR